MPHCWTLHNLKGAPLKKVPPPPRNCLLLVHPWGEARSCASSNVEACKFYEPFSFQCLFPPSGGNIETWRKQLHRHPIFPSAPPYKLSLSIKQTIRNSVLLLSRSLSLPFSVDLCSRTNILHTPGVVCLFSLIPTRTQNL